MLGSFLAMLGAKQRRLYFDDISRSLR
jgi:hypothetical protein